jgi:type II secretory pathway component PulM
MPSKYSKRIPEGQERLPLYGKNRSGIWAYAHPRERQIGFISASLLLLLSVLYIYFMISSVVHVAARQELARAERKTSAEVAELETKYLTKTESITDSYARSLGYVAISERSFVEKPANTLSIKNTR